MLVWTGNVGGDQTRDDKKKGWRAGWVLGDAFGGDGAGYERSEPESGGEESTAEKPATDDQPQNRSGRIDRVCLRPIEMHAPQEPSFGRRFQAVIVTEARLRDTQTGRSLRFEV